MNYVYIDGISSDGTKVLIGDIEVTPEYNVIYVNKYTYVRYIYSAGKLVHYTDPNFVKYDPAVEFSRKGDKVTITLDNTNGDYDELIPHGFNMSSLVKNIDFKNGLTVKTRNATDSSGLQHYLFDIEIDRTNKPTVISYI